MSNEDQLLGAHDDLMEEISTFTTDETVVAQRFAALQELRDRIRHELPAMLPQLNKPHAIAYSFMMMQAGAINGANALTGSILNARAAIWLEDDDFDAQPNAPYNIADTINLARWWLAEAEDHRKNSTPDREIEAYRTALDLMDAFEPTTDTLSLDLAAPIAGGANEFSNAPRYITNEFHYPFRLHATIASELARRLEALDPNNPEIAQLDHRAMTIIETGLTFFAENDALDTQAGVNLRLSQIASFATSSLDDPDKAEAIHGTLRPVWDARKKLALSPAKDIEWEMVEHGANILMYRKRGMVNEEFELGVQSAIIAMSRRLGEYFNSVPDYIGINAVYQKALGDRFPDLIAAVQQGVDSRNAPAIGAPAPDQLKK